MQIHNTRDTPCRLVRTPFALGFLNAAPRPHRGFDRRIRSRTRVSQLRVHRSRRLPSRARVRSRVVGRTALKTAGLWCTVLVGGRPNEMEGESARPVRGVSRQQFTNDEAAAHPPPPRQLRLLRRRVRARAADGLADGAADPVRPACHPAADRGPTVCGAGSTHVHRAIDARTGGGAAAGGQLTVPLNPFHRLRRWRTLGVWAGCVCTAGQAATKTRAETTLSRV